MKSIFRWSWVLVYLSCNTIVAQNAPITTIGTVVSLDTITIVPIRVSDFYNIGSCGLMLMYDPDIIIAFSVTTGPLLGGNLASDLSVQGQIILGWYDWPGVSLPDSSVIFNITFLKVTTGTSDLTWFDDGPSCYYSTGGSTILNDLPTSNYYFNGSVTFQSEAPLTMAPFIKARPGTIADIPLKVIGFRDIGKVTLTMQYDPAVLIYQSFTNNSGFPGLSVHEIAPGTLVTEDSVQPGGSGMTLPDSNVLFTAHLSYIGGSTGLIWKVDGGDCEYAGLPPLYPLLKDIPKVSYYFNGSVTPVLGVDEPVSGIFSLVSYPNPFTDHTTISWYSPASGEISLSVFNIMGEMVESFTRKAETRGYHNMELSSCLLMPGIYFVRVLLNMNNNLLIKTIKIIYNI